MIDFVSIFSDGEHLLETGWTFWYDKKQKKASENNNNNNNKQEGSTTDNNTKSSTKLYEEGLKQLGTFYTVEQFWK